MTFTLQDGQNVGLFDDKILLLSTCSYEKNHWRMVIAARRVRDGESKIDVNSAVKASDPLMP